MPAKSKIARSDWNECIACKLIINSKHIDKHHNVCGEIENRNDFGYIFSGILFGVTSPYRNSDVPNVPKHNRGDVVLLSPSVMSLCGLCIGKPCLVSETYVFTAWPSPSLASTGVGLHSDMMDILNLNKGDLVSVGPFSDVRQNASSVHVKVREWRKQRSNHDDFLKFLKRRIDDKYLCVGNIIHLSYYGRPLHLCVTKIKPQEDETYRGIVERHNDPEKELSESICKLDISGTSADDSMSSLDLSTNEVGQSSVLSPVGQSCLRNSTPQKDVSSSLEYVPSEKGDNSSMQSTPEQNFKDRTNFRTPIMKQPKLHSNFSQFYKTTLNTEVIIEDKLELTDAERNKKVEVRFEDIGGLSTQISAIREIVELPLNCKELFEFYGLPQPKGILLFGPSGTGKTLLAKAIASEVDAAIFNVSGPEVWSKFYGETESKLRSVFTEASERSPSVIVIDELDALCLRRDSTQSEQEKRVVATVLTLMDGINNDISKKVLVLGITSKPDNLDPALRRPGRFDREIEIGVPNPVDRLDILQKLLSKVSHSLSETDLREIADCCHGFVGADLAALCQEAGLHAVKTLSGSSPIVLKRDDFAHASTIVKPSGMREVQLEVPKVLWTDIGGQEDIKLKLRQAVEWPLKHPEAFTRMGIQPPRGILMYGPPGCSKTMIAKALATESGLNFLAVKGPELFSKWVGESERAVREVFRKARAASPSIVFFDEIDALAIERGSSSGSSSVADRVLAQLLTEIDGVEKLQDVTVIAATNRPDMIDKALLRPGRIDRILYVPLPDAQTREDIFRIQFKKMPISENINVLHLVEKTEKYSGAEVTALCREAAMFALQENIESSIIKETHFDEAFCLVTPRLGDDLEIYRDYQHKSGLHSL